MTFKIPVYLIVKETGHFENNEPQCILLEAKLTKATAEMTAKKYEGAIVKKVVADKYCQE